MDFVIIQKQYHNSKAKLHKYLTKFIKGNFHIIDDKQDNDIRICLESGSISTFELEKLTEYFDITFINVDGTELQIDIREK